MKPTEAQFRVYQKIFDYFNKHLFEDKLPECMLNFSRKDHAAGFFATKRWQNRDSGNIRHEISLNPMILGREPEYILSTLVHEMCHLWQHEFGKPSRSGYHNSQWANKMEKIGLMPSHNGLPGGARTGQQMSDYIIEGGKFEKKLKKMPESYLLPFTSMEFVLTITPEELVFSVPEIEDEELLPENELWNNPRFVRSLGIKREAAKNSSETPRKIKYSCPQCQINAWGKPNLNLKCGDCDEILECKE